MWILFLTIYLYCVNHTVSEFHSLYSKLYFNKYYIKFTYSQNWKMTKLETTLRIKMRNTIRFVDIFFNVFEWTSVTLNPGILLFPLKRPIEKLFKIKEPAKKVSTGWFSIIFHITCFWTRCVKRSKRKMGTQTGRSFYTNLSYYFILPLLCHAMPLPNGS